MKKSKKGKLIIFIILFATLVSIFVSLVFSNLLFLNLNGDMENISSFASLLSISGLFESEEMRLLFLLSFFMCAVAVVSFVMMGKNKETFESDTTTITEKIITPVAIGQGQYGTARWLTNKEVAKEYTGVVLNPTDRTMMELVRKASEDKQKILGGDKSEINSNQAIKTTNNPTQEGA